mgnify:CR=1 FL=1|jgi:phosphoglycolate phosphatase
MKLSDLLQFDNIIVQCHDNPDADALASGFGVYEYLRMNGKSPRLVYGGRNIIHKSNLVLMVDSLGIPIEHVDFLDNPQLLVTVDCQYGGGNVTFFKAENVAVIDHHRVSGELPAMNRVMSYMGSCATIVWDMLREEGVEINRNLATALYYGLYTDTGEFTEITHSLDRDLRDYIEEYRLAIVKAGACDPNVLGIISDFVLEVDAIDICMVFSVIKNGVKLSFRSCIKEVSASEMAQEVCRDIGSGGGHYYKAGGFIPMDLLIDSYNVYCKEKDVTPRFQYSSDDTHKRPSDSAIKSFLEERIFDYLNDTKIIYGEDFDTSGFKKVDYKKRPIPMGCIIAKDILPVGCCMGVRTAKGDISTPVGEDTVVIIGEDGSVQILNLDRLNKSFRIYKDWRFTVKRTDYVPKFKNKDTETIVDGMAHARVCIPVEEDFSRAFVLKHKVKLFKNKDDSSYISGRPGDIMVLPNDDRNEAYMISKTEFEKTHIAKGEEENRKKAVVFDLDGTLLYTLEDLKNATNYALKQKGMPERTLDEVRRFVGNGVRLLMERAVPQGADNPEFEETFALFKEYYDAHCNDNTSPYDGIMDLLEELKVRGIKMAIVSNKIDFAVKSLDKLYFKDYMTAAIGEMEEESIRKKPAPDMVQKALKELQVSAEDAIYVGDSDVDIATAKNSGLECVSVTWGFRDVEFLKEHGATNLIDEPVELLNYV